MALKNVAIAVIANRFMDTDVLLSGNVTATRCECFCKFLGGITGFPPSIVTSSDRGWKASSVIEKRRKEYNARHGPAWRWHSPTGSNLGSSTPRPFGSQPDSHGHAGRIP